MTDADDMVILRGVELDPDAAEVTNEEMAQFCPATEVLPLIFGQETAGQLMRRHGRTS